MKKILANNVYQKGKAVPRRRDGFSFRACRERDGR
jgi:hypothetical protein